MFKRYLMAGLLSLTLAQTIVWSCHAVPREIATPSGTGFSLPDATGPVSAPWKYYKLSRPSRDTRDLHRDLDPANRSAW